MGFMDTLGDAANVGKTLVSKGVDTAKDHPWLTAAVPFAGPISTAINVGGKAIDAGQKVNKDGVVESYQEGLEDANTELNRSSEGRNAKSQGHTFRDGLNALLHGDKNGIFDMLSSLGDMFGYKIAKKLGFDGRTQGQISDDIGGFFQSLKPSDTPNLATGTPEQQR